MDEFIFLITLLISFVLIHPQKKYITWINARDWKKIIFYSVFISTLFVFPFIFIKKSIDVYLLQILTLLLYFFSPQILKKALLLLSLLFLFPLCLIKIPFKYLSDFFLFFLVLLIYEFVRKNFVKSFKVSDAILGSFPAEFICENGEKIKFSIGAFSLIATMLKEKKIILHPFKKIGEKDVRMLENMGIKEVEVQIPVKFSKFLLYFVLIYLFVYLWAHIIIALR